MFFVIFYACRKVRLLIGFERKLKLEIEMWIIQEAGLEAIWNKCVGFGGAKFVWHGKIICIINYEK